MIVICAIILTPIGGLSIQAQEITESDYVENETEYIETEEQESELESDLIIEGGMIEIPPRDGNTAEIQVDGLVVTPVIKDDGSYGLSDGVYAFENIGNSGLFMDIQQDKYLPGYHMQQYAASGNPATTFDRSCLFKITWRSTTNSYIIRSMLNNRLTFYFSGNEVLTKEIPPNDADVPDSDTFQITYITGSGSFIIKPYNSTYVVAANNTTASGMAGAPDSYLKKSTGIAAGDQGKWRMYKYTGATQSGVVTHKSISTTNGIEVETTISIALKTWTTEIGKNTPHLIVNPDYTDMVTVNDWDDDTYTLTFTPIKSGMFKLRGIIRTDGTTTAFRTYALTYYSVPPVNGKTTFIENVGTEKFVDIEGSSSNTGAIIEQDQFSGQEQAKWIFEVQSSGYFRIKSAYSNKYIGVESNGAPTTVKQYATSSDYTLWRITETSSGNYRLSCKATEASGYVLAAQSQTAGNGSNLEMTAYTEDTNYRDEWNPIIMLPTNGDEIEYSQNGWSSYAQNCCNCYAYAINNQVYPGSNWLWFKQQRGCYKGDNYMFTSLDEEDIYAAVEDDFEQYNESHIRNVTFQRIGRYDVCPEGTYKVALVATLSNVEYPDYHWYRQDSDGLWSHKRGLNLIERTDYSGNLIIDPYTADRGNYTEFLGYYAVSPWNGEFDEAASGTIYCYINEQNTLTYDDLMYYLQMLSENSYQATTSIMNINRFVYMIANISNIAR